MVELNPVISPLKPFASWLNVPDEDMVSAFHQSDRLLLLFAYALYRKTNRVIVSLIAENKYRFIWQEKDEFHTFNSDIYLKRTDIVMPEYGALKFYEQKLKTLTMNTVALRMSCGFQKESKEMNNLYMSILYYRLDVSEQKRQETIKNMLDKALLNYRLKQKLSNNALMIKQRKI